MSHGYERSDRRNRELHRVAFQKLEANPERRSECLARIDSVPDLDEARKSGLHALVDRLAP